MSEVPGSLTEALILLQSRLPRITKEDEAQAGSRTYRYANLASIHDAVFPLLAECGLAWTCPPTLFNDRFVVAYELIHALSGETKSGFYPIPEGAPQAQGSAITYARRYALCAVLGIAPADDDDDGKTAQASYEQARADDGRMNRAQMREHGQLERDVKSSPRRAERIHGPAPDNAEWETAPEDQPGSSTDAQRRVMGALFTKLGVTDRPERLGLTMSLLDMPELATSRDLSFRQAESLLRLLQREIRAKEGETP